MRWSREATHYYQYTAVNSSDSVPTYIIIQRFTTIFSLFSLLYIYIYIYIQLPSVVILHSTHLLSSSSMADPTFYVGILGNIISILVFLAPISTFRRIIKKRDVEDFKGLPYICTLLCASLWCFYAFLKPNSLLILSVNAIGVVFQFIYITIFISFAPKNSKIKHLVIVGVMNVGFLGAVIAIVLLAIHGEHRITIVGVLCAGFTLGMYGAPLGAMRNVIETRSVEFMPFNLSFFLFMNGAIWSFYAFLTKDFYVGIPNGIGCILGAAQLILYMVYRNSKPIKSTEEDEKEGSAHLVKGTVEMGSYKAERVLSKGRSLPIPKSVSRQTSFQKLGKTNSLAANYEVQSNWPNVDLEKADHARQGRTPFDH